MPERPALPAPNAQAPTPSPMRFFAPPPGIAPPPAAGRAEGLQALLDGEVTRINGLVCAHVRLDDGTQAGVNADFSVDAASVIKVPVMVALYDAWESGEFKRTPRDEKLVRGMITRSRNTATNALIDKLGMARINAWLSSHGFTQTFVQARILDPNYLAPNTVSAFEMTRLMEEIARGQVVSPAASDEMRRLLLAQRWRERIPAGLPKDAVCGNKTGTMKNLLHDVAFIEAPTGLSYTIAVLIEREDRAACTSEAIAELSRRVYEYLTGTSNPAAPAGLIPPPHGETVRGRDFGWTTETRAAHVSR